MVEATLEQIVPHELAGLRLDRVLPLLFHGHSRSELQHIIQEGLVKLNGQIPKKRQLAVHGDVVELTFSPRKKDFITPQKMNFDVLFEDEFLFVINKPAGLVVHPAPGNWQGTFVNGFLAHCDVSDQTNPTRPGIVHRLDKDTSGVLIAAKTTPILHAICKQFADRTVEKEYLAIVIGTLQGEHNVHGAIGRNAKHRQKMAIVENGKEASTSITALRNNNGLSFIKALPRTGRTHQIRVHLASLGFPILGDALYGKKEMNERWKVMRHMLHCEQITLCHPVTHARISFRATLPEDMSIVLEKSSITAIST